jgi:hypothetical protein
MGYGFIIGASDFSFRLGGFAGELFLIGVQVSGLSVQWSVVSVQFSSIVTHHFL